MGWGKFGVYQLLIRIDRQLRSRRGGAEKRLAADRPGRVIGATIEEKREGTKGAKSTKVREKGGISRV